MKVFAAALLFIACFSIWAFPQGQGDPFQQFIRVKSKMVVLKNVRIIDGTGTAPKENQTITIIVDRIGLGAALYGFERTVDDALCNRLLTVEHEVVHELRQDLITELGIGQDFPLLGTTTT